MKFTPKPQIWRGPYAFCKSLVKSRRQQLHQQVAQVLEEQFTETVETQPELVAHHYTEASLIDQAIPYWQKAGERAAQRSAYPEATGHLTKGLELLKTLPDTPARTQQELTLQNALGQAFLLTKGYASREAEQAYTRAAELCRQLGDTAQLFPVLYGLWSVYINRADYRMEASERLLSLAESEQDLARRIMAHFAMGLTLFYRGEAVSARKHLEQAQILYDPQQHAALVHVGTYCRNYGAATLWMLGYPDRALARVHEALALARQLADPHGLTTTLSWIATLHLYRREGQAAQQHVEAGLTLSQEQGFETILAWQTILRSGTLITQGQSEEGISQLQHGLAAYKAAGETIGCSHFLSLLAEAYKQERQFEEGLEGLAKALAFVDRTEERCYEAELYRLKGELTLRSSVQRLESSVANTQHPIPDTLSSSLDTQRLTLNTEAEAEACFHKAIEIARQQEAKSWELRAATSLARLWQSQGKINEARDLLVPIYDWFTEGFDTKDLQEAKALLDALSEAS